jgi:predicted Zn-dependent protease
MIRIDWLEKHLVEAEQMFYENRVEEGLERLNNLLYEEPGYGNLHNHLGWAYLYYSADSERAELHLKMAVRFAESFPAPYLHLGALYVRLGRYNEAIHWLKLGLTKHQPNRIAFLQNIAQAYELQGKWSEAIQAYKEAMMNSVVEHEVANLNAGIKRCRKKRWTMLLKV